MAKLSLWLLTLDKDRPFTFLDHAIKCGDSLLGVTSRQQVEAFDFVVRESDDRQITFWRNAAAALFLTATDRRKRLEASPVMTPADVDRKEMLLREAEEVTMSLRLMCDLLAGAAIATANGRPPEENEEYDRRRVALWRSLHEAYRWDESVDSGRAALESLRPEAQRLLDSGLPEGQALRRPFHWCIEFPEVLVDRDGFDAVIGNPPFMHGQKITGIFGTAYRGYLVGLIAKGKRGSADLCAYFFLRAWTVLAPNGQFALLATNTIAQGDTRAVALDQLAACGASITRAVASRKWPGQATLEMSEVWLRKGNWTGVFVLDDRPVNEITAQLTEPGTVRGYPHQLAANKGKCFKGIEIGGLGFVLARDEAEALIAKDGRNRGVLYPMLGGTDLNTYPDQIGSRWIINFGDLRLEDAEEYPDCMRIVRERVLPSILATARTRSRPDPRARRWWQFRRTTPAMRASLASRVVVLYIAETSATLAPILVANDRVFTKTVVVFPSATYVEFASMMSSIHSAWVVEHGSSMRTDPRYIITDCFETFPFPEKAEGLEDIGQRYHAHRQSIMQERQEGLTATYNRFHDHHETARDIQQLRNLHVELDRAVALAYGWDDLGLGHGFHQTRQGERFTISEVARRKVLDLLLKLNHERHAVEVAAGLFEQKKPKSPRTRKGKDALANGSLF
jgi:hypothetical protein